jgi:alpha-L-fucosidase
MMTKALRIVFLLGFYMAMAASADATDLATLRQNFVNQSYGMFICYSPGSFTGEDWAHSNLDVNVFTPTGSIKTATDQWAASAKAAGMKYGILTAKHIDGFSLWNSPNSTYDIASTTWYNNPASPNYHVDLVNAYADSFRAQGLGVSLYYSMWDQHAGIGTKYYADEPPVTQLTSAQATAYVEAQLHDLLTHYGQIDTIFTDAWFMYDPYGVNYNRPSWTDVSAYIKSISPNTLLVENNGTRGGYNYTDIISYEHYWGAALPPPGNAYATEVSTTLRTDNKWFYASAGSSSLKAADVIGNEVHLSNARNAAYALDVTPDTSGLLPANQVARLQDVKTFMDQGVFGHRSLAYGKPSTQTTDFNGGIPMFQSDLAVDGDRTNFACTNVGDYTPSWQVDLGALTAIGEVNIFNRTDQVLGRLRDITIQLLAADGTTVLATSGVLNPHNTFFGGGYDLGPPELTWILGQNVSGRYIRVSRTAEGTADPNYYILTLAEVEAYTRLYGDTNGDDTVNGTDLNTVLSNYNQTGMNWAHGDFNGDGSVNGSDLNTVLSNYNQSLSTGAAVPEPSTMLLAATGLFGLLASAWRRRRA